VRNITEVDLNKQKPNKLMNKKETPVTAAQHKKSFASKLNSLQHGEVLTFNIIQSILGEFLAIGKHFQYLDSLIPSLKEKFKDDEDFKLIKYYEMIAMFVREFKKISDRDPVMQEMIAAGERLAFLAGMAGGGL